MLIRPATSFDAAAIAYVQVEGWRTTYRGIVDDEFLDAMTVEESTERWIDNFKQPAHSTFVAIDEHADVVAFASCGKERTGRADYEGELHAIYILKRCRRRGLGKRLVASAVSTLLASGCKNMLVWVLADNPSRRFYEDLGGTLLCQQDLEIGKQTLVEVAYGWDNLGVLVSRLK